MCGRFTLKTPPDQWSQLLLPILDEGFSNNTNFRELTSHWQPRYNIAPTQNILAIRADEEGNCLLDFFRWGLIPAWASELSIGNRMINARGETLHQKRSFASLLKNRRCMVIADGYYEWQKLREGGKQACWISPKAGGVLFFAGLWESNRKATGDWLKSCAIITTAASPALSHVHDRMPAVVSGANAELWMNPQCDSEEARSLLGAADEDFFQITQVNRFVNNPRHDGPECLKPLAADL